MSNRPAPENYRTSQIILHWVVVLGIIIQIAVHESIVRVMEAIAEGDTGADADVTFAWIHVSVGSIIMLAVVTRLYLRWRYGTPAHTPGTSPKQARIANIMHRSLYALLLAMVITGMLTWNQIAPLGDVHFAINVAIFFLALGHAFAALYNHFIRKDGTMHRMMLLSRGKK